MNFRKLLGLTNFYRFPKAAAVDNFLQIFHQDSSGIWKPVNIGTSSFQEKFMIELVVFGKISRN
jgi:hypothetical protein